MPQERLYLLSIGRFDVDCYQFLDHIFEQQNQQPESKQDSNFYLLIDSAKNHTYIKRWLKTQSKNQRNQIGSLFQGTIDESSPLEVSPLLLSIDQANNRALQQTLIVSESIGLFGLIETSLSKQALIQHLQPFLQAEMPDGGLALFRFYDPLITQVLYKMFDEQEYQTLLKPINNWWVQKSNNTFKKLVSD